MTCGCQILSWVSNNIGKGGPGRILAHVLGEGLSALNFIPRPKSKYISPLDSLEHLWLIHGTSIHQVIPNKVCPDYNGWLLILPLVTEFDKVLVTCLIFLDPNTPPLDRKAFSKTPLCPREGLCKYEHVCSFCQLGIYLTKCRRWIFSAFRHSLILFPSRLIFHENLPFFWSSDYPQVQREFL